MGRIWFDGQVRSGLIGLEIHEKCCSGLPAVFNWIDLLGPDRIHIIQAVMSLRNACAHNNCILNNLSAGKPIYEPRHDVMQELSGISSIGPGQRRAKMSNDRMQQIVTALYAHRKLASWGVFEHRADSLALLLRE